MIVHFRLLYSFRLKNSDNLKGFLEIGYFTNGVLESSNLDEFLHPGRLTFEHGEQAFLGHARRQFAKDQSHFLIQLLLQLVVDHSKHLAALPNYLSLRWWWKVEICKRSWALVTKSQQNWSFSFVINFSYASNSNPRVFFKPIFDVVFKLSHLSLEINPSVYVVKHELNNSLPLRIHPTSLHLFGLDLVSRQKGRIDDGISHPFEGRLKSLLFGNWVLALAHWRQQKFNACIFYRSVEGLSTQVDVCEGKMKRCLHKFKAAKLRN